MDTWSQGIPASYGRAKAPAKQRPRPKSSGKRTVKKSTKSGKRRASSSPVIAH